MRPAPRSTVPRTVSRPRATPGLILCLGLLSCPSPGAASAPIVAIGGGAVNATTPLQPGGALRPTAQLPGPIASAQRLSFGPPPHWLIEARGERRRLARLAVASGGTFNASLGLLSVPASRARAVANDLGDALTWAGPNVAAQRLSSFDQPGGVVSPWSRSIGLPPSLTPAPGTLATIGIVDDAVDHSVAELASVNVINGVRARNPHGSMVTSTAAAPFDGTGVVGVAPGAPVLSWGGTTLYCNDVTAGITNLVNSGAKVINVSLGFIDNCFPLWQAVSYAYARGVAIVAASGNDGDSGNPPSFPASYPHVITAGAIDSTLFAPSFSDYNPYVDIAAPGVDVPVDVPRRFDKKDGSKDGVTTVSGTSFASPYVSGAASWILGARPELDPAQLAGVLRTSSRDIGRLGWDSHTGYGLVQIGPAMATPAPAKDALEPNDDPSFTRSRGIFRQPLVWSGGDAVALTATGDSADDPIDAYRIRVPAHARVRASVEATTGLTNLFAFDQAVVDFTGAPLDASTASGHAADTVTLRNRSDHDRGVFLVVNSIPRNQNRLLSAYTLTVQRP